jgi:hypothetical protein
MRSLVPLLGCLALTSAGCMSQVARLFGDGGLDVDGGIDAGDSRSDGGDGDEDCAFGDGDAGSCDAGGVAGLSCGADASFCFGPPIALDVEVELLTWMQVRADFNGDGIDDLIQVNHDLREIHEIIDGAYLYFGAADGGLRPGPSLYWNSQATFVAVGDLNGDGWPDFVTTSGNMLDIEINQRDGTFASTRAYTYLTADWNYQTLFADLDGDGQTDLIACASNGIFLFFNFGSTPDGGNPVAVPLSGASACTSLAVADLNGDGRADVASFEPGKQGNTGNIVIRLGIGDGGFFPPTSISVSSGPITGGPLTYPNPPLQPGQLVASDLNGDGLPDLIWPNQGGFGLLLNQGEGTFGPEVDLTTEPPTHWSEAITVADFNGDGLMDVATVDEPDCDAGGSFAYVFLNEGDGGFAVGQPIAAAPSNHSGIAAWRPAGASLPSLVLGNYGDVVNLAQWAICVEPASIFPNLISHDGG